METTIAAAQLAELDNRQAMALAFNFTTATVTTDGGTVTGPLEIAIGDDGPTFTLGTRLGPVRLVAPRGDALPRALPNILTVTLRP